jgi:hypothetical protein
MSLGVIVIVANKIKIGKSVVPSSYHALVGTTAYLLMLTQSAIGMMKYNGLQISEEKKMFR